MTSVGLVVLFQSQQYQTGTLLPEISFSRRSVGQKKTHSNGTITLNDIDRLDNLSDDQILAEASYWKKVNGGGNAIRFRHKVGDFFVK